MKNNLSYMMKFNNCSKADNLLHTNFKNLKFSSVKITLKKLRILSIFNFLLLFFLIKSQKTNTRILNM